MTPIIEKLFVNRDRELDAFRQMIKGQSPKRIMTLCAPGGMGKSWLMARLQHECSCEGVCMCEVDFRSSKVYDCLAILRHAREAYGAKYFNDFTALVNEYTQPQLPVQIDRDGITSSAEVTVEDVKESQMKVAGRDVIVVRDNFFQLPVTPLISLRQIRELATAKFMNCLHSFIATYDIPVVWFFDHFEFASEEIVPWLRDEFLTRIRDLDFRNLVIIIAGRTVPLFGIEWNHVVCTYDLGKLTVDDFEEYVKRTTVSMSRQTVKWLHRAYDGDIQRFALELQVYEQEKNL